MILIIEVLDYELDRLANIEMTVSSDWYLIAFFRGIKAAAYNKMRKHPPNRRGISFEVGAQLEARDRLKNWYFLFHNNPWMDFFDADTLYHQ